MMKHMQVKYDTKKKKSRTKFGHVADSKVLFCVSLSLISCAYGEVEEDSKFG